MTRMTLVLMLTMAVSLCPRPAAAAPPVAQVREAYDAGRYPDALKLIGECLLAKDAAESYDRCELLMLKGECLLRLKSASHAAHAFEDARAATDDPGKQAAAMAADLLLRRSPSLTYTPKTGPDRTPIDVVAADSRKTAMLALRSDLLASLKPRIDRALGAQTLTPTLDLLAPLREVAVLEFGATGVVEQTRSVLRALGTHALDLIRRELKAQHARVEQINAAANEIVGWNDYVSRRGLHTDERKELAAAAEYLRRIDTVAREGRRIARLLGDDAAPWDAVANNADEQVIRIESIVGRPQ
jgi:hypothetical protein